MIIGIDVGKNGAIAWSSLGKVCVEKMPDTVKDLWDLIESISNDAHGNLDTVHCYLEQVSSSPQMGVVSAFSFGNGFGTNIILFFPTFDFKFDCQLHASLFFSLSLGRYLSA